MERRGITGFERYREVASLLLKDNCSKVLDVGSNGPSPLKHIGFQVLSVDVQRKAGLDVVANASHLPFRSMVFDCVTAIDILEHIDSSREKAINEIKRCGKTVIIHTPLQDNKVFMGRVGDSMILEYVEKVLNKIDENTLEHVRCGEPSPKELRKHGFKITQPDWNMNVWLVLMKSHYLVYRFTAPIIILLYLLVLRRIKNPPYWGGYLVCRTNVNSNKSLKCARLDDQKPKKFEQKTRTMGDLI